MFFNLINIAILNNHIVYKKFGNSVSFLDFKNVVTELLIGRYTNWQLSFPLSRISE